MNQIMILQHEFTEYIPEILKDGIVYISIEFATVSHKCCCGCGLTVVTPLSPTDWSLTFDGLTVSLHPSIGNWSFPCKSHYWIKKNRVTWARKWTSKEIQEGRSYDQLAKEDFFYDESLEDNDINLLPKIGKKDLTKTFFQRMKKWFN